MTSNETIPLGSTKKKLVCPSKQNIQFQKQGPEHRHFKQKKKDKPGKSTDLNLLRFHCFSLKQSLSISKVKDGFHQASFSSF